MNKDDATWLNVFYAAVAGVAAFVFWKAFTQLGIETGWVERYSEWYTTVSRILALILGPVVAFGIRAKPERHDQLLGSIGELRKVSFPSLIDTRRMTVVVVIVCAVVSAILSVFDIAVAGALKLMLN